ncbi:long-chain-fatty-acid--CoA ligase, putative [Entamoeba histolytica HM-1:IMSS-B]|uniref:Long-chain-fatty-acid--CoA ligase, putative n=6 Tax=Entamoeba histolytica TaxID=5759 RepID=C4M329_ENTH1|nr:long-chain-fatty-acid--CoA ligase, putative [Entamoeba histolytica HM-1:IMSS]EMD46707.1 AMP dependent ligase/synthetase, putative [Entamoeba histolytica KU27]EMH74271.1 long-chain-fatty-acid--CoA ligase, putative [Entamoeba histolytica HM-1:IMSS-B]EMS13699.1 AMP dependent ligase/synthetase, putative [Entamoeba histolytica HM-3:IMSS]ENY65494.1 AMP dependent ligase/synthetase, putative [Entamoeba histolytica HM-1:IMSS-A]GAT95704.1 long-chain-fatty-acid--coa ligase putative [Entamoeba histolyt|eukprot:XP_652953.1 long-chain-fatty-acid--CoA ligase, putative [Entamoeba histolytica HM-1:IMSS]
MEQQSIQIQLEHIDKKPIKLFDKFPKTIVEALMCNQFIKEPALTIKDDNKTTISWKSLIESSFQCAYSLIDIKHQYPIRSEKSVILCMNNCKESFEICYGCFLCGLIPIFISPKVSIIEINKVIQSSKVIVCFFDYHQKNKFERIQSDCDTKMVVVGTKKMSNPTIQSYLDFIRLKEENAEIQQQKQKEIQIIIENTKPEDICEVVYIPNEEGGLKGVIWSHNNIICECYYLNEIFLFGEKERYFHFLSNSFFFERIMTFYIALLFRFHIFIGTPELMRKNANGLFILMKKVCPTIMLGIPRIYEKIIEKMKQKKGSLNEWAMKNALCGISQLEDGGHKQKRYGFAIKVLKRNLKKIGLHKTRILLNAINPLTLEMINELHEIGLSVYDGLCLPETTGYCCINRKKCYCAHSLGSSLSEDISIKIFEGKIIVEGPTVACGYTEQAQNKGWFTETTFSSIFKGRIEKKEHNDFIFVEQTLIPLIITKTGEWVYPLPIEEQLNTITTVRCSMVVGDNEKFIGCVLFTTPQEVEAELKEKAPSQENIGKDPFYGAYLKERIEKINVNLSKSNKLKRFVVLIDSTIEPPLSDEKRQQLLNKYSHHIGLLFKSLN